MAAGGTTIGWARTQSVEIMDLGTNTWTTAPDLPFASIYVATPIDGAIYMWEKRQFVYKFEAASDEWDLVTDVKPIDGGSLQVSSVPIDADVALSCKYL